MIFVQEFIDSDPIIADFQMVLDDLDDIVLNINNLSYVANIGPIELYQG